MDVLQQNCFPQTILHWISSPREADCLYWFLSYDLSFLIQLVNNHKKYKVDDLGVYYPYYITNKTLSGCINPITQKTNTGRSL